MTIDCSVHGYIGNIHGHYFNLSRKNTKKNLPRFKKVIIYNIIKLTKLHIY